MREILFRGKRVDNGEWVYGSKYNDFIICYLEVDKFLEESDLFSCNCVIHEVIPETVGQFTGLKDKKGNKIFEGDILEGGNLKAIDFEIQNTINKVHFSSGMFKCGNLSLCTINRNAKIIVSIHDKQSDHEQDR